MGFNLHLFEFAEGQNPKKGGVLPVALLSSADFDATLVDMSTILLEGVPPVGEGGGPILADVGTDNDNSNCECIEFGSDGLIDISMKFRSQDIAANITPGEHGDELVLTLSGNRLDGTPFEAQDCIRFVSKGAGAPPAIAGPATALGMAYPNPFNPLTQISYSLAKPGPVTLSVYDVKGRLVERLVNGVRDSGDHTIVWNATGVASGIYFYRLIAGNYVETRKFILLK